MRIIAALVVLLAVVGTSAEDSTLPARSSVLEINYCHAYARVFQELKGRLELADPTLLVSGGPLDPPAPRPALAAAVQMIYVALLAVLFFGDGIFGAVGVRPPEIYVLAQQNKMAVAFATYFIGNTLANTLMSTGAFEITYNQQLVWSKLAEGRMPSWDELAARLQLQL